MNTFLYLGPGLALGGGVVMMGIIFLILFSIVYRIIYFLKNRK